MSFKQRVLKTIDKFNLFQKGDKVLVGVSGGPDSTALILVLASLKKELGINLRIAHINHKLRSSESERDMKFSQNLAKRLGIPFYLENINISRLKNKGASLEELARIVRQDFFINLVKKHQIQKIALGHNQDDQAETVLMRIIRGSGVYGLQAIAAKRKIRDFTFVRPLIEVSRQEINTYLKRLKITPCIDSTNSDTVFFRNKIRNVLLPFLENNFNKNIRKLLANLAEIVSLDYQFLEQIAGVKLNSLLISKRKLRIRLNLKEFQKTHIAMQRMLLRLSIKELLGSTRKFDFRHWQEVQDLILNRPDGSVVDLPKRLSVKKQEDILELYIRKG